MSLETLYKEDRRRFIFKLYPYTRNYDVSEDIVQEAFIKAFDKIDQFDPQKGAIKGWFVKILFSCLWDYMRESKRQPVFLPMDAALESDLASYDEIETLKGQLADVKNKHHQRVLFAYIMFGCSYKETAAMCKTKESSVRKIVQRFRGSQE